MTFRNNASQREREAMLRHDRRNSTLIGRAATDLMMEERGRFARAANITGEAAPASFPAADWTSADPGLEPVLGYSVEDQEPVGTQAEIEASVRRAGPPSTVHDVSSASSDTFGSVERSVGDSAGLPSGTSPTSTTRTVWRRPL